MSEIDAIRAGMARCRQRIAEMEAGKRGQRDPTAYQSPRGAETVSGAGIAFERQLQAQRQALEKLEWEYVQAMLARWTPRRVIEAMEPPPKQVEHG